MLISELDQLIGQRLQTARKIRGFLSARAFARHHNIPATTYAQHEAGKRSLNPNILVTYCNHLNVDPGWLLTGEFVEKTKTDATVNLQLLQTILKNNLLPLLQVNVQHHSNRIINFAMTLYSQALQKQNQLYS